MNYTIRQFAYHFLLAAIIFSGILLRTVNLSDRPMHHDEILHTVISIEMLKNSQEFLYKYDPMLHGPVLYHTLSGIFKIFGISEFSARLPVALLGIFITLIPLLFLRYLSPQAILAATILLSFSPILIFFSRFIIHDYFIITSTIIMFLGAVFIKPKYKALVILPAISLQISIKQNAFITITLLAVYLLFEYGYYLFCNKNITPFIKRIVSNKHQELLTIFIALSIAFIIFIYFFSGGFRNFSLLANNPFSIGFSYWVSQHQNERLGGHFAYNLYVYLMYEIPFTTLLVLSVIIALAHSRRTMRYFGLVIPVIATLTYFLLSKDFYSWHNTLELLKIKTPFDASFFIFLLCYGLWVTVYHLQKQQQLLAFLGFFFFSTYFTYSFVGEKVPWLSEYPLLSGIAYLIVFFDRSGYIHTNKRANCFVFWAFLILSGSYLINSSLLCSHFRNGSPTELISQVHTTAQFRSVFEKIAKILRKSPASDLHVLILNSATWPAYWYLRNYRFDWQASDKSYKDYQIILKDGDSCEHSIEALGFYCHVITLNGWWQPDYDNLVWSDFLRYSITHEPFGYEPGYTHMVFYYKPNIVTISGEL